jgi:hypothetical protein
VLAAGICDVARRGACFRWCVGPPAMLIMISRVEFFSWNRAVAP